MGIIIYNGLLYCINVVGLVLSTLGWMMILAMSTQVISGFMVIWYYYLHHDVHTILDISFGNIMEYTHSSAVHILFLLLYLHYFKALVYGSIKGVYTSGIIFMVFLYAVAFLGYGCVGGNMSYWVSVVLLGFVSTLVYYASYWLLSDLVLGSIFFVWLSLIHFLVGLLTMVFMGVHLGVLQVSKNSNQSGMMDKFNMLFITMVISKDVLYTFLVLTIIFV